MSKIEQLGSFPIDGAKGREAGDFIKITNDTALKMVSGIRYPVLLNFFCSNDVTNMGQLVIPTGGIGPRQTEYDKHDGDALFYVEDGPVTFLMKESGDTFHVETGEFMSIPGQTEYKVINYTGHILKCIFIISPNL